MTPTSSLRPRAPPARESGAGGGEIEGQSVGSTARQSIERRPRGGVGSDASLCVPSCSNPWVGRRARTPCRAAHPCRRCTLQHGPRRRCRLDVSGEAGLEPVLALKPKPCQPVCLLAAPLHGARGPRRVSPPRGRDEPWLGGVLRVRLSRGKSTARTRCLACCFSLPTSSSCPFSAASASSARSAAAAVRAVATASASLAVASSASLTATCVTVAR
jgi:hypothetical protein